MKTPSIRKEDVGSKYPRQWWVVNASDVVLGRMATQIANVLRGKHKPIYTPHVDTGDFVIVINAEKMALTGNKLKDKFYYRHTGYPGGLKQTRAADMLEKKPEQLVYLAVKRMMAKNALNRHALSRLKIYSGGEHPHAAQQPKPLSFG